MPYRSIRWKKTVAEIIGSDGKVLFSKDVTMPSDLSDQAISIIAEKYLCNSARPDTSLQQLFDRVSDTIAEQGMKQGYFDNTAEQKDFADWLKWIQVHRLAGFNSPVYFNVGLHDFPQSSACFINGLVDSMDGIAELGMREANIFKNGSGSGVDYSVLRSSKELVQLTGNASGPVSFLKVHDTFAGEIRSGGVVRRSAKMAVLDVSHPDIIPFIRVKQHEENKLRVLSAAGVQPYLSTTLSDEVSYQNTNLSVRMSGDFIKAACNGDMWPLIGQEGQVIEEVSASSLMDEIADNAWSSAEPGLHFRDNINKWNTVPHLGDIDASNPCSEFLFINDSACNLSALSLVNLFLQQPTCTFREEYNRDELIQKVIETMITAQDILVDYSKYPDEKIRRNSHRCRPLGLGFTDLGSYLMLIGMAYGSDEGRDEAGRLTSAISAEAHLASTMLAKRLGSYEDFNAEHHIDVVRMHRDAAKERGYPVDVWEQVIESGMLRNAQLTLLAPCGTMGYLLDNITTGIEPIFSHVSYKNLAGGGQLKLTNRYFPEALLNMGYAPNEDGSWDIKEKHKDIFACAGEIDWQDHIGMMAAVQPFLSGSISKCVCRSTICLTAEGMFRLGDLVGDMEPDTFTPVTVDVASIYGLDKADQFYYGGMKDTRRLELVDGRIIEGTPNHRVMVVVQDEISWKRLDEITQDDYVAIQIGQEMFGQTMLDAGTASYYGYALATGSIDQIPSDVLAATRADVLSFLQGFLLHSPNSDDCYIMPNDQVARDIMTILGNFGYLCQIEKDLLTIYGPSDMGIRTSLAPSKYHKHFLPVFEENILDNHRWFCIKVGSINRGRREVCDFQIPESHAFIGNSMINHNTVNMPESVTPDDIKQCYRESHELGLKSVIVYRDGSKTGQVLKTTSGEEDLEVEEVGHTSCERVPLNDERKGGTHKFTIAQTKGYLTWSEYEDGRIGEIFIRIAKEGSTLSGLIDALATVASIALQYGVPLSTLVDKMMHRKFEPAGITRNKDLRFADSIVDYVFRYLGSKFLTPDELIDLGLISKSDQSAETTGQMVSKPSDSLCLVCGMPLRRLGTCDTCVSCGYSGGACS